MIQLDLKSNKPIYEQIIEQMKLHVMRGYLNPGDMIPSVRKLALDLKVTPGTVAKAYQELERQKIIETIRGKGTYIAGEIVLKQDETRLLAVKKELGTQLLELKMMGYKEEDVVELLRKIYKGL